MQSRNNEQRETKTKAEKVQTLLALSAIANMPFKRQIAILSKAGFQPSEIAELLDSAPKTISARLTEIRREATSRQSKEGKGRNDGE